MVTQSINPEMEEPQVKPMSNIKDRLAKMYSFKKQSPETTPEEARRITGQQISRAGETILGYPGNLKKAVGQARDYVESLFGVPEEERLAKKGEETFGKPEEGSIEDYAFNPPTTPEIREKGTKQLAEKITGEKEYFEPKTKEEEVAGEFTQDLTSMFMPGTRRLSWLSRIGAPVAGNLTKQGVKYFGGEEETAEKAKLGVMLMSTLASQSNPAEFSRNRIAQAINMVPETVTVSSGPLARRLWPVYRYIQSGLRGVPSASRTREAIQDLADQSRNGRMNLRSLMKARDDINEFINDAGGFDVHPDVRDRTVANLNRAKRAIIETIDENLSQRFPEAAELYRTGYEAAAVTHQSNAISNFLEKRFGKTLTSAGAKLLFPAAAGGAAIIGPKTVIGTAALLPLYQTGKVMYRIANSPILARYYQDVITSSTIGNSAAMVKSLSKFDRAMLKEEEKEKKGRGITLDEFKSKVKSKG